MHREFPDTLFDVEAAAWNGGPVYFIDSGPWRQPAHVQGGDLARVRKAQTATSALVIGMLVGAIVMAFRNVRLNRGDRRTAFRLGAYMFLINLASWVFSASHVPDMTRELVLMMGAFGPSLFYAGSTYVIYLALEPYVRRRSPRQLISWTRLCAGKFDDPLVGRDVLIGMAAGGFLLAITLWGHVVPEWLGDPPVRPRDMTMELLMGPHWAVSSLFEGQSGALFNGLFFVFMPLLLQVVFRKPVIAQAAFFLLLLGLFTFRETHPEVGWISSTLQLVVIFALFLRGGLLATTAAFYVILTLQAAPLTRDLSVWYAPSTIVILVALFGIAVYAFRSALGGRPAFSGLLRE
jgi:hypothetical protein